MPSATTKMQRFLRVCLLPLAILSTSSFALDEESRLRQITDMFQDEWDDHDSSQLRRRLSASDPKSVESKGYICSKGNVPWDDRDTILSELPSFIEAYKERNEIFKDTIFKWGEINSRGNGLFHSFLTWVIIRQLKPSVIVESGVGDGYTSWLIAKATEEWAPVLVRVDPAVHGWDGIEGNLNSNKHENMRGELFADIAEIDWDALFKKYKLPKTSRDETLIILDDHQDQLRRLIELVKMGFSHVIVDDNYMPGVGPHFSIKDACDGPGRLRRAYTPNDGMHLPKRCDNLRSNCESFDFDEVAWRRYALQLEIIIDAYWEGPPLAPLDNPYGSVIGYIEKRLYEGPLAWTQAHSQLHIDSTKDPLFGNIKYAAKATGISQQELSKESGRYINLAYIRLRTAPPGK